MAIQDIDGAIFRRAVIAGADWVRHTRAHLNMINVFPVPDGDTGTNMALSLSATAAAIRHTDDRNLSRVLAQVAEASILGAKGNSGIILAHWFLGLSNALDRHAHASTSDLAQALSNATDAVYNAIEKPVEGTILTVMRATSEAAKRAATRRMDLASFIETILQEAERALARTPEMLRALRDAQVVDAGAQGYVNFLKGIHRDITGQPPPEFDEEDIHAAVAHPPMEVGELTDRFCTELVVRGSGFESEVLRARFHGRGSCLMVATTGSVFKLHVHTDHPDEILKLASTLGTIEERKVDDMQQQRDDRDNAQLPLVPLAEQDTSVAIVCDSVGDIPTDLRQELGIELVPLQVLFGDRVFRDQVDLSTPEFYERLQRDDKFPSTSQPAPRAFVEALERLRNDREVVVCTVSGALSGTYRSALSAMGLARQPRVEVFDCETASLGEGLMAICAARLAQRGASTNHILEWLDRWRRATGCVFTPATLKYLRRGGRIGRAKELFGSVTGQRPILTFEDGQVRSLARARGNDGAARKINQLLKSRIPDGSRVRLGLVEYASDGQLEDIESNLRQRCDVVDLVHSSITGTVGAHLGPGVWGVFYQLVEDDDPLLA